MCGNSAPSHAPLDGNTYDPRVRDGEVRDDISPEGAADTSLLPVTCVTPEQATAYCDWVGGRLPGTAEWALAARGVEPVRFAWGNDPVSCERHWRPAFTDSHSPCCDGECTAGVASVGSRSGGVSPHGLTDVLSARVELMGMDAESTWAACRRSPCMASGLAPGAIDGYRPAWVLSNGALPATFRCAWEER